MKTSLAHLFMCVWVGERKRLGGWEGNMSTKVWLITLLIMLTTSKQKIINGEKLKEKNDSLTDDICGEGCVCMRDYGKWDDPTSSTQKIIKNVIQKINTITSAKLAVTVGLLSLFLIYCSLGTALHVRVCISVRLPFAWHTVLSLATSLSLILILSFHGLLGRLGV